MKVMIEGHEFEIPDEDVLAYVEELEAKEAEEEAQNKYIFGVNVNRTSELAQIGEDIRSFIDTIGDGHVEVQVSINAKLNEFKDKVVGFDLENLEPAIGYAEPNEFDYDDDDYDDWPEEDKLRDV